MLTRGQQETGISVECFVGQQGKLPLPEKSAQICVATIEKADRIVTSLLTERRAAELRLVVIDELHFAGTPWATPHDSAAVCIAFTHSCFVAGESHRGAVLEGLVARLLTFAPGTQIIGMSATVRMLSP
jgi:replicative superfamily II helicase